MSKRGGDHAAKGLSLGGEQGETGEGSVAGVRPSERAATGSRHSPSLSSVQTHGGDHGHDRQQQGTCVPAH